VIRAARWLLPGSPFVGSDRLGLDDGDEVVLYNPVTCHIHLLNRPAADVLAALDDDPTLATPSSGTPHADDLTGDEQKRFATLLQDLRFLGLFID
jgi:hypothetical protein